MHLIASANFNTFKIMNPLIFHFKEESTEMPTDLAGIEYDHQLNLHVHRESGLPAIVKSQLSTETYTKANREDSDTDRTKGINFESYDEWQILSGKTG